MQVRCVLDIGHKILLLETNRHRVGQEDEVIIGKLKRKGGGSKVEGGWIDEEIS